MLKKQRKNQEDRWIVIKHFLIIFLPLLVLVCGIIATLFHTEKKAERTVIESHDVYDITLHKKTLIGDIKSVVADLMVLSEQHEIKRMFEDIEGDYESEIRELADEFLTLSKQKGLYDQINLLDETGMELIRVNFNNGNPYAVPEDQLQFNGHRYYFKEPIRLKQDEVYISPFELNIEKGAVEQPLKPVIRFGTPVLDAHGRKRGIVVLNYLGENLLQGLDRTYLGIPHHTMLLNPEGFWLKGLKPEDEWGFMYEDGKDRTFGNAFPEAWQQISNNESGEFYNDDGLFSFATVYPLLGSCKSLGTSVCTCPMAKLYYWKIVNYVSSDVLNASTHKLLGKYSQVFVILAAVLGGISWVVAHTRVSRKQMIDQNKTILRTTHDGFFITNTKSQILDVNDAYCRLTGYSREELLKMSISDVEALETSEVIAQKTQKVIKTGSDRFETKHKCKDGKIIDIEVSANFMNIDGGRFFAFMRDITERKRAEESLAFEINEHKRTGEVLRMSEEKYRRLVESLQDNYFFYSHNTNGIFTYLSPSINNILGYSPEEFLTHYTEYLTDNPINKLVVQHTELSIKGIKQLPYEVEVNHKDGTIRTLQVQEVPVFDKNGKVIAVEGIAEDITERKRADEQLKESEQKFRTIFDNVTDGILVADAESKMFLTGNKKMCQLLGYSEEEIKTMGVMDIHPEKDLPYVIEQFKKQSRKEFTVARDLPVKRKDGSVFYADINSSPLTLEGKTYIVGIFRDITEEMRAEEKLRESEQRYRSIFESAMDGIGAADLDGYLITFNDAFSELTGYSREELLNMRYQDITPPEYHDMEAEKIKTLSETGVPQEYEKEYMRKDGSRIPLLLKVSVIRDNTGKPMYFLAVMKDMARIKQTESVLRASEKKYKTLIENLPQKIFLKDINSTYVSCNENYAEDLKIKPDEIVGKTDYGFYPKELAEKYRADDKRIIASRRIEDIEEKYIKDGQEFIIHTVKTPIRDEEGNIVGILGIFWDITEQKKAEEEIRYLNEYLNTILESIDVYIRVVDPKLNVEYENPTMKRRFGNGVGKPCYLIWQCNDVCENCTSERAILTNRIQRKEEILPNGLIFSVTSVPLKTREGRSVAIEIIYDITRLKRSEYEIRSLTSRIFSVQEEERKRISRELHDETGQALIAIKLNLAMIGNTFTKDVQNTKKTISSTKNILTQIMRDIRKLSYDLRPAVIDDMGMAPAMQSYSREFAERTGVNVVVKSELNSQRFPPEVEISLYRILQEALTNVAKHSKAKNVTIELLMDKSNLIMKIEDDGCGFDTNKNLRKGKLNDGALGLIGIRERVTSLGGDLEITSTLGKGTKLIVRLPESKWHIYS
jgi:PAS domain S-box-containing protein